MATLSLTVGAMAKNLTIAAADVSRWLEAYRGRFALPPEASQQEIFDKFSTWLLVDVANGAVLTWEQGKAATDAAAQVPPIPLTPV